VWDDTIAVPTSDTLTAVDMATGAILWTAAQTDHPEAADGVFVGATAAAGPSRSIRALDAATGDVLWEAPGQSSYGDLLAVGDGIVAVLDGTEIVAYELRTGDERWRRPAEGPAQPQLIAGTTLISLWEATLVAMSTSDGSTLWTATEPLGSPLMNNVSALESALYIAVNSRQWGD
jgi:outer membrane protein assembly factor BamB